MDVKYVDRIFQAGMLCDVHIGYWTGLKKLHAEDLGLKSSNVPDDLISLGRKRLLPVDALSEFKAIDSAARRLIKPPNGFRFFATASAHFIPKNKLTEVNEKLTALKNDRFIPKLMEFQDEYPAQRRKMMKKWLGYLTKLAKRKRLEDEFIEHALGIIDSYYPSQDEVIKQFTFYWDFYRIGFAGKDSFPVEAENEETRREIVRKYEEGYNMRVQSFLEDIVLSFRSAAAELCEKWSEDIAGGTQIHHKRLKELREFIHRFKSMNFIGDRILHDKLESLEKVLPENVADINGDDNAARGRITKAMDKVKNATKDLGKYSARSVVNTFLGGGRRVRSKKKK
jgi:hypothetical protein